MRVCYVAAGGERISIEREKVGAWASRPKHVKFTTQIS